MRPSLALFVVLLLAPFAAPAAAQPSGAQPLDRLLPEIRRSLPGQFLDAEPGPNEGGQPRYRLRWLTPDGRVIQRDVDARNGRVVVPGADREGFGRQRPDGGARPNFRAPGFDNEDGAPPGRFGNRGFIQRRPFGGDNDNAGDERGGQRPFAPDRAQDRAQDRFNRPNFGDGGFPNRGGFGGRRFGDGAPGAEGAAGAPGGRGRFGGGRGRGRGGED